MKNLIPYLSILIALFVAGCATEYVEIDRTIPPYYHAQNVFHDPQTRAALPRAVIALPCSGRVAPQTLRELDGILVQELAKVNLFEVKKPSADKVRSRRSEQDFTMEEAKAWAGETGADGIMICKVTSCSASKPLVLGVSLQLWSLNKEANVWAVDETLDSQMTLVANGARNYYLTNFRANYPTRRSEQILDSPHMFFQYAFAELFSTISPK